MQKLIFERFELLSENAENQLISGFSEAFEGEMVQMGGVVNGQCPTNTNCAGGNCVTTCGTTPPSTGG